MGKKWGWLLGNHPKSLWTQTWKSAPVFSGVKLRPSIAKIPMAKGYTGRIFWLISPKNKSLKFFFFRRIFTCKSHQIKRDIYLQGHQKTMIGNFCKCCTTWWGPSVPQLVACVRNSVCKFTQLTPGSHDTSFWPLIANFNQSAIRICESPTPKFPGPFYLSRQKVAEKVEKNLVEFSKNHSTPALLTYDPINFW